MPEAAGSEPLPPLAPAPPPSSEIARRTMVANRSRDTRPEIELRSALHRLGLRFRKDHRVRIPPRAVRVDIAFPRDRLAVLVDGCFWHGCPDHMTWPKANGDWWRQKIGLNQRRDRQTDERLRAAGWSVVRIWEHEPIDDAAAAVAETLAGLRGGAVVRTEQPRAS